MTEHTEVRLDDLALIDEDDQQLPADLADDCAAEAGMSLSGPPEVAADEIEFEDGTGAPE
jgi:hypothetical protein